MPDPIPLLAFNAGLQILVSSLLGFAMLVPRQPWVRGERALKKPKHLLAVHLDWIMLAFMQGTAAFIMATWPACESSWVAVLLIFGGWTNALPYLLRGLGIDAFVLGGPPKQILSAAISGLSSAAIVVAWASLVWCLAPAIFDLPVAR